MTHSFFCETSFYLGSKLLKKTTFPASVAMVTIKCLILEMSVPLYTRRAAGWDVDCVLETLCAAFWRVRIFWQSRTVS